MKTKDIIKHQHILSDFDAILARYGAVGINRLARILYLALTTRLFLRPVSIWLKGQSAAGKTFLLETVLMFFPAEAYFKRTSVSSKTLAYSRESFAHRFIVLTEAAALTSGTTALTSGSTSYLMRTLLTERHIIHEFVVAGETRKIAKVGPTGLVTTTTAHSLHDEMETRLFALAVDDSPVQTKGVLKAEADLFSGEGQNSDDSIFQPWREFQTQLANGERRVVIPYAGALPDLIPPVTVRLRRDFPAVLTLVQAHALLHQLNRGRDEQGQIVATLDDYVEVRSLLHDVMAEVAEQAVSKEVRETVEAVESIRMNSVDSTATIQEIARHLSIDRSAAFRRVEQCLDKGFLAAAERQRGKRMNVMVGEPLPEDQALLPTAEKIQEQLSLGQSQRRSQSSRSRKRKASR